MSINKAIIIGFVGSDPAVKHLESGLMVATFTVATAEHYKDKSGEAQELTEWHNIVCWRKLAEIVDKYVVKGQQVYIEGKITNRSYEDKAGVTRYITEIVANQLQIVGKKSEKSSYSDPSQQRTESINTTTPPIPSQEDDDLPF